MDGSKKISKDLEYKSISFKCNKCGTNITIESDIGIKKSEIRNILCTLCSLEELNKG